MRYFFLAIKFKIILSLYCFYFCIQPQTNASQPYPHDNDPFIMKYEQWIEDYSWPSWASSEFENSQVKFIDEGYSKMWLRWVTPLPKLIKITGQAELQAADISVQLRVNATDTEKQACEELINMIKDSTAVEQFNGSFRVLIGICDDQGKIDGIDIPGAKELHNLENKDQAYVICPLNVPYGLAIAGLTEKGVYYGVKTLQQLIKPKLGKEFIVMPVMLAMDWPDLSERGQWGIWGHNPNLMTRIVEYMADRKMNLMEVHYPGTLSFDRNNRGIVNMDPISREQLVTFSELDTCNEAILTVLAIGQTYTRYIPI